MLVSLPGNDTVKRVLLISNGDKTPVTGAAVLKLLDSLNLRLKRRQCREGSTRLTKSTPVSNRRPGL